MGRLLKFFEIFALCAITLIILAPLARAQTAPGDFNSDFGAMLNTPLDRWKLNGVTGYMLLRLFGQAYAALRSGGGLKGIFNAIVYGENAPKVIMRDYATELKLTPEPTVPPQPEGPK